MNKHHRPAYSGYPAAVVILDGPLPDGQRQRTAPKFSLSEIAFLEIRGDRVEISWFTPAPEVKRCGTAVNMEGLLRVE